MNIYPQTASRTFPSEQLHADLLVAGGGLAGLCAALAAARDGLHVVLNPGPTGTRRQCVQRGSPVGQRRHIAYGQQ